MRIKRICALVLSLLFLLTAGCRSDGVSPEEITDAAATSLAVEGSTVPLERDKIEGYFGFSDDLLRDFSVLVCSDEEAFFEIGALTPDDRDDLNTIIDGITRRHSDASVSHKLVNNTSSGNVMGFLLMQLEETIIYVLAQDTQAAEQTLYDMGANEIN